MDTLELAYRRILASPHRRLPPELPLPEDKKPKVVPGKPGDNDPLPKADVLIVTYTKAEGEALADILTPGLSSDDWTNYRNGFSVIHQLIEGHRAPALQARSSGIWAQITIGDTKVVVMKSNLHPATDGPRLPIATAWKQWVKQAEPSLVISTGTAGAVQGTTQLGDVVVSGHVSWDCRKQFKGAAFAGQAYTTTASIDEATYAQVTPLLQKTSSALPNLTRPAQLWLDGDDPAHIITTDFFAFDDEENSYGLQTFDPKARAVEMDDAAMAYALEDAKLPWLIIRNASDPQMPHGSSLEQEAKDASHIYEEYGQVTSWGSALSCWAACAAL
jgi:nucleoside phosphorylase